MNILFKTIDVLSLLNYSSEHSFPNFDYGFEAPDCEMEENKDDLEMGLFKVASTSTSKIPVFKIARNIKEAKSM